MGEEAVPADTSEKGADQLLEELGEAFRDIAEGRYDTDPEIIRERIARKRARQ